MIQKNDKTVSFKRNIFSSYASQIYVTLIGIVTLPMYIKYMGAEAYGLVGFFSMLQVWFNLLDMGLTPTMTRETARFKSGALKHLDYLRLVRALQIIFFSVAVLGGGTLAVSSQWIAKNWLQANVLPPDQIQTSLRLMAICIALRWMSGLYRSCINGAEKIVWLGSFNSLMATLRFLGALPVLIWVEASPEAFFYYQAVIAIIEVIALWKKSSSLLAPIENSAALGWSLYETFSPLGSVLKFSITIFFTSSVWVFVTQVDKLILSKMLALEDYGIFTLAVLAASGVTMVSGPISSAVMPRMTRLNSEKKDKELIELYRSSSRMVALIAIPVCLTLSFFPEQVLLMWTGNVFVSERAAYVLRLYSLGNGFLIFSAFPYYLQFAKGDLRLHLLGNMLFLILLVPLLMLATWKYGMLGAAYVWLAFNGLYFFSWVPIVHTRFDSELHKMWLIKDLLPIVSVGIVVQTFFWFFFEFPEARLQITLMLIIVGLTTLGACACCSKEIRVFLISRALNAKT